MNVQREGIDGLMEPANIERAALTRQSALPYARGDVVRASWLWGGPAKGEFDEHSCPTRKLRT